MLLIDIPASRSSMQRKKISDTKKEALGRIIRLITKHKLLQKKAGLPVPNRKTLIRMLNGNQANGKTIENIVACVSFLLEQDINLDDARDVGGFASTIKKWFVLPNTKSALFRSLRRESKKLETRAKKKGLSIFLCGGQPIRDGDERYYELIDTANQLVHHHLHIVMCERMIDDPSDFRGLLSIAITLFDECQVYKEKVKKHPRLLAAILLLQSSIYP